jgi:GT2 family glycosyltransferase
MRCEPRPAEVVVVDQGRDGRTRAVVADFSAIGARVIADRGRGRGRACNIGIRSAKHELILMTDDDCTVSEDWVAVATRLMASQPTRIVTGRVLAVPSTKDDPAPRDYTGTIAHAVLYAGNMACSRRAISEIGGFDESIVPSSEDNELCHRWLRGGRSLRYEPALTIWHHAWRTPRELRTHYRNYARGNGVFYAKYLRRGDFTVVRYLMRDVRLGVMGVAAGLLRGSQPRDRGLDVLGGLSRGLWEGWRTSAPQRPAPSN